MSNDAKMSLLRFSSLQISTSHLNKIKYLDVSENSSEHVFLNTNLLCRHKNNLNFFFFNLMETINSALR